MPLEERWSCKVISLGKHSLYTEVDETMETKLKRISKLSAKNPYTVFNSVGHLISTELLESHPAAVYAGLQK